MPVVPTAFAPAVTPMMMPRLLILVGLDGRCGLDNFSFWLRLAMMVVMMMTMASRFHPEGNHQYQQQGDGQQSTYEQRHIRQGHPGRFGGATYGRPQHVQIPQVGQQSKRRLFHYTVLIQS
jgi:hypothetical protein